MAATLNPASAQHGACDCHVHNYDEGYALAPLPCSSLRTRRCRLTARCSRHWDWSAWCWCSPRATAWTTAAYHGRAHCAARLERQFAVDGRELPQRKSLIDSLPSSGVIDHTGKFIEPVPPADPAFLALLAVLDRPRRGVKLSAPCETSKLGPPRYDDVAVLAKALLPAHPERCLWASNWPHPNRLPPAADAQMLELLGHWCRDAVQRARALIDNPARVYGF